jgi:hypothetical protein
VKVLAESSRFRSVWDLLIILLVFASCFLVPYQVAFQHEVSFAGSVIVYLIDLAFLLDIFINFHTPFRQHGSEVADRSSIARHYLHTFFFVDLLASFPFDALLLPWKGVMVGGVSIVLLLRLLRLLRVVRLFAIFRRWERQSWTNAGFLRILRLVSVVVLLLHLIGCAWFAVPYMEGFPDDSWVVLEGLSQVDAGTQYLRSLYWGIVTVTAVGYVDITPTRNVEYAFAIVVLLLGASLWAYIIGNIASLISNLDSAKAAFWNRVETVNQYLRTRQVPAALNDQVRGYYEYLWTRYRGMSRQELFADLPEPVRLDILLHLTRELVEKVPLFRFASAVLRNALLLALRPEIYAPDTIVAREGEPGNEIYFVGRGRLEILSAGGTASHGVFEDGDYFGDLSMLLGEKRTASVRAETFCDLYVLSREHFERIKKDYPEFKDVLKAVSAEKSERRSALVLEGVVL